jgi:hypothetical protein
MASLLEWKVRILLLAEFQAEFYQLLWTVVQNKEILPAGGKLINDSGRWRLRQIAETLVEERLISWLNGK